MGVYGHVQSSAGTRQAGHSGPNRIGGRWKSSRNVGRIHRPSLSCAYVIRVFDGPADTATRGFLRIGHSSFLGEKRFLGMPALQTGDCFGARPAARPGKTGVTPRLHLDLRAAAFRAAFLLPRTDQTPHDQQHEKCGNPPFQTHTIKPPCGDVGNRTPVRCWFPEMYYYDNRFGGSLQSRKPVK